MIPNSILKISKNKKKFKKLYIKSKLNKEIHKKVLLFIRIFENPYPDFYPAKSKYKYICIYEITIKHASLETRLKFLGVRCTH
jgi:hypothetical protein